MLLTSGFIFMEKVSYSKEDINATPFRRAMFTCPSPIKFPLHVERVWARCEQGGGWRKHFCLNCLESHAFAGYWLLIKKIHQACVQLANVQPKNIPLTLPSTHKIFNESNHFLNIFTIFGVLSQRVVNLTCWIHLSSDSHFSIEHSRTLRNETKTFFCNLLTFSGLNRNYTQRIVRLESIINT